MVGGEDGEMGRASRAGPGMSRQSYFKCADMLLGFSGGSEGKECACNAGDLVPSLGWEDPLEKEMATHSSILAWRIPWTEQPGGLQSMGSQNLLNYVT